MINNETICGLARNSFLICSYWIEQMHMSGARCPWGASSGVDHRLTIAQILLQRRRPGNQLRLVLAGPHSYGLVGVGSLYPKPIPQSPSRFGTMVTPKDPPPFVEPWDFSSVRSIPHSVDRKFFVVIVHVFPYNSTTASSYVIELSIKQS